MGSCGCRSYPLVKMPAPEDGVWYVVEVYPGCRYCGPSWGLSVRRVNGDSGDPFHELVLEETQGADFDNRLEEWAGPILNAESLIEDLEELDQLSAMGLVKNGGLKNYFHDALSTAPDQRQAEDD